MSDFQIDALDKDVIVNATDDEGNVVETFSIKDLINIIIEFINKLIRFEF